MRVFLNVTYLLFILFLFSKPLFAQVGLPTGTGGMDSFYYVAHIYLVGDEVVFPDSIKSHFEYYVEGYQAPSELSEHQCQIKFNQDTLKSSLRCEAIVYFKNSWRVDELKNLFGGKIFKGEANAYLALSEPKTELELELLMVTPDKRVIVKKIKIPEDFKTWVLAYGEAERLKLSSHSWSRKELIDELSAWDPSFKGIFCKYWGAFEKFQLNFRLVDPAAPANYQLLAYVSEERELADFSIQESDCEE